jgi:hypothetical protein
MRGAEGSARRDVPEPTTSECSAVALADIAQWAFARPAVYGIPAAIPALRLGETTYRESRPVTSMTRSAAASLLATHEAALVEAGVRRRNAARFVAGLGDNSRARTIRTQHLSCAGYLRLPVRLPNGIGSLKLGREASQLGIFSSYPIPLSSLPQLAGSVVESGQAPPGAETLVRELVTLPTHSRLAEKEVAGILEILGERRQSPPTVSQYRAR